MKFTQLARRAILSLAALAAMPALAFNMADGPATAPVSTPGATAPATQQANGSLKVTVVEVTGVVQVRTAEDQPWQRAKVGMVVDEGAEFRTGPRSSVRCTIPPDQSFTLDRLGTVKVLTALKNGDKIKTDMLMKYGRTTYSVEAAGLEHESTIASPSGTLAVRGTVVSLYDQPPYAPSATSYTGNAMFRDAHRRTAVGSKGGGTQTVSGNLSSAANTALNKSVTDPKVAAARTEADDKLIASEVSRGGVVSFDAVANIAVIRGGTPIFDNKQLVPSLPGRLQIVLRWTGNADVNLGVIADLRDPLTALFDPTGFHGTEFLYPGYNLNNSPSGGHIPFDHRGGPNGGTEIAYWFTPPPDAVLEIQPQFISGVLANATLNVFLDGQKETIFYTHPGDPNATLFKTKTLTFKLSTRHIAPGPLVFLPAVPILESIATPEGDQSATISSKRAGGTTASANKSAPKTATTPTPVVASKPPALSTAKTSHGR